MTLRISTEFEWNDKVHGNSAESFWIWVEDPDNQTIYHSEYLMIEKKKVKAAEDARKRGESIYYFIVLYQYYCYDNFEYYYNFSIICYMT